MPSVVERLENHKAKITVSISPEKLEEAINHAYIKSRDKINIPGFRKGKAPRKLIEIQFGKDIFYEDAIDFLLPGLYDEAIKEHDLDVVSRPEVDMKEISAETGATLEFEVYLRPEAKVMDYTGLEYKEADTGVTDEEIAAEIDKVREKNSRIMEITDRPVQNGDIAVINFEGFIDNIPFDGGKAENHELVIGSHSFIDTFEEQLIGMNIGDEADITVRFPEEYHEESLKGKPAVFKVRINGIKFKELPEVDDEFAQDVSDFNTLDEYKSDIRDRIVHDKEHHAEHEKENQLVEALIERAIVDIPEPMIDTQVDNMVRDFAERVRSTGLNFEDYLGYMRTDIKELRANYRPMAEKNVKARLALEAVARNEGFGATDDDIDAEISRMSEAHSIDKDKLMSFMTDDEKANLTNDIKVQKAMEHIIKNAVMKND